MKIAWVTYLDTLSCINAILIPRISAHPPILAQCKVHRPWALFREGTVYLGYVANISTGKTLKNLMRINCEGNKIIPRAYSNYGALGRLRIHPSGATILYRMRRSMETLHLCPREIEVECLWVCVRIEHCRNMIQQQWNLALRTALKNRH